MRIFIPFILLVLSYSSHAETETAIFAGGCFWCMEKPYDELDGVVRTTSGYTGGSKENATYKKTSSGTTGHYEAIEIEYDPSKVNYETLLNVFWKNIDPFDDKGQFCDKGPQYRAAIFVKKDREKVLAKKTKDVLQSKLAGRAKIVTEILPAQEFYDAEDYHQDYYLTNPVRYKYYRYSCGRDKRLDAIDNLINTQR